MKKKRKGLLYLIRDLSEEADLDQVPREKLGANQEGREGKVVSEERIG